MLTMGGGFVVLQTGATVQVYRRAITSRVTSREATFSSSSFCSMEAKYSNAERT